MSLFDFFFPEQAQASHLRRLANQSSGQRQASQRNNAAVTQLEKRVSDLEDDLGRAVGKPFGDGGLIFSRKSVSSGSIAGAVALAGGVFLATDELTL